MPNSSALPAFDTYGELLRHLRRRAQMTQRDFGLAVGYSEAHITRLENGQRLPDITAVKGLFVEALDLKREPELVRLLIELATKARGDASLVRQVQEASTRARTNLPTPLTSFIGRAREMAEVKALLGSTRLLSLIGPPGVGKTRLAVAAAWVAQAHFPDGVWWAELAPITEPEFVMPAIAYACGVPDLGNRTALERLQQALRDKVMLLVLDNFEQVLAAAPQVAQLLAAAPSLKVITTSREPLHLSAEYIFDVPSLALPKFDRPAHQADEVAEVAQSPAVGLFVQRAEAVLPAFALTAANAGVVAEICQRLDGLPLAIELAAARIGLLTPKEVLTRLGNRLSLLTSGAQDLPNRQRTLRATINWSYTLLTPDEQTLFRRFAVFAGGATLGAIEAVCMLEAGESSVAPALDVVAALVAKSLLKREEDAAGESRYRMLETIREYALERLTESSETDACWQRHVDYLWNLLGILHPDSPYVEMKNVERFEAELANLMAALVWSMTTPNRSEVGYRLLDLVDSGHYHLGSSMEWHWLMDMLLQVKDAKPTIGRARALENVGQTLALQGEFAAARELWHECFDLFEALNEPGHSAYTLDRLGWLAREQGDTATANAWLGKSLERFRTLEEPNGMAEALVTMAGVAVLEEDASRAALYLEQAAALPTERNEFRAAWMLNHAGHIAQLQGDYQRAVSLHEASRAPFNDIGALIGLASAYHGLAETALSLQDAAQARRYFVESLQPFYKLGDKLGISWSLCGLAGAHALGEDSQRAARLWGAGEALRERIGCRIALASRLNREHTITLLHEQLGEAEFARLAAEGAQMTMDEAVACALADPEEMSISLLQG